MKYSAVAALFALLLLACSRAPEQACALPPAIEAEFAALPDLLAYPSSSPEAREAWWALARKYPENLLVQLRVQDIFRGRPRSPKLWDRALGHYHSMKNRTAGELLEARLLLPYHSSAKQMFDTVLERDPDLPWAHLVMVEWAGRQLKLDHELIERHFSEFRRLCPDSIEAFRYTRNLQDPDLLKRTAAAALRLLAGRGDRQALHRWTSVWSLIARVPEADSEAARGQLEWLRGLDLLDSAAWYDAVSAGYRELGDDEGLRSFEDHLLAERPDSEVAFWITRNRWWRDRGARGAAPDSGESRYAAAREWRRRWPDLPVSLTELFHAASSLDLPPEQFLPILDEYSSLPNSYTDGVVFYPSIPLRAADYYVRHRVRLERVPDLVIEALRENEENGRYLRDADVLPFTLKRRTRDEGRDRTVATRIMSEYYWQTGQKDRFDRLVKPWHRELEGKPAIVTDALQNSSYTYRYHEFLELARHTGISTNGLIPLSEFKAERWPIEEFEAETLDGTRTGPARWRGKVVLLHIWATWCGECRSEQRDLQRLHEELADDRTRTVVSICVDRDPEEVRRYMKEHSYTFPVIVGREYAENIFAPVNFPQDWLARSSRPDSGSSVCRSMI